MLPKSRSDLPAKVKFAVARELSAFSYASITLAPPGAESDR